MATSLSKGETFLEHIQRNYPKGSALRVLSDTNIENGRRKSWAWLKAHPDRRYCVRQVNGGEYGYVRPGNSRGAIACIQRVQRQGCHRPRFQQIVIGVPKEAIAAFRADLGEAAAEALFWIAARHPHQQRSELVRVDRERAAPKTRAKRIRITALFCRLSDEPANSAAATQHCAREW